MSRKPSVGSDYAYMAMRCQTEICHVGRGTLIFAGDNARVARLRIKEEAKRHGLTLEQLAERVDISQGYFSRLVNGNRPIRLAHLAAVAQALGTPISRLIEDNGGRRIAPIVGYVGAGQQVISFDADEIGETEAPPTATTPVEAVIVRGDSMYPAYLENDLILYEIREYDIPTLLGRQVVARLADGRTLVKVLRRGSETGLWNLESFNAPTIENVALEWAVPVRWVEKR